MTRTTTGRPRGRAARWAVQVTTAGVLAGSLAGCSFSGSVEDAGSASSAPALSTPTPASSAPSDPADSSSGPSSPGSAPAGEGTAAPTGAGGSTGTSLWAALGLIEQMRRSGQQGSVVTLLCDGGERYAGTYYDDAWVAAQGLDVASYTAVLERFGATGEWAQP